MNYKDEQMNVIRYITNLNLLHSLEKIIQIENVVYIKGKQKFLGEVIYKVWRYNDNDKFVYKRINQFPDYVEQQKDITPATCIITNPTPTAI